MPLEVQLVLSPLEASDIKFYLPLAAKKAGVKNDDIKFSRIIRKSIDSRQRKIKINLQVELFLKDEKEETVKRIFTYPDVHQSKEVIIIGAGPAGLFAALRLIELGLKPLIFERGKRVDERKKDIEILEQSNVLNCESNYCFGEGGAGTFSDGKLYTRSKKRGDHAKILDVLNYHGADDTIMYESHPHIGSDKLPVIISNIRKTITDAGGTIFFNSKVVDLKCTNNRIKGILLANGDSIDSEAVVLATGHSARDIYYLLQRKNITLENKSFAMGVRIEHPQELINRIQYHGDNSEYLPAASYSIVQQVAKRGVYSFCMCPGGQIVPASTSCGETVVNGMSNSGRDSDFANSGLVVQILPDDYEIDEGNILSALKLQEKFEKSAFQNRFRDQQAPAQRIQDFLQNKESSSLPPCSYKPGIVSSPFHLWMPDFITQALKAGFKEIDKKMKGFLSKDGIMVGVESRTSSPVRIPRNNDTGQHITIEGLFPCGEGAGYSGGIVSSAVDGEFIANKVAEYIKGIV